MANNQDDFEMNPQGGEEFPEFKETSPLMEAWKNSPMLKILVVGAGLLVLVGGYMAFGGSNTDDIPSQVSGNPGVTSVPGDDVDPQFEQALRTVNEQRAQAARERGGSALPTPIGRTRGGDDLDMQQREPAIDPLEQWRQSVERRQRERDVQVTQQRQVTQQNQQQFQQQVVSNEQNEALVQAMARQFQAIMEARAPQASRVATITPHDFYERQAAQQAAQNAAGNNAGGFNNMGGMMGQQQGGPVSQEIIIPAGEIIYGQLLTMARSDVSTPVLAQLASGPLRGARAIGSFQRSEGNFLVLSFNRVVVDGIDYPISAVAVDPATTGGGLATEVDYHWFTRVILPGAAAFIEGLADAYAQRENTVTVSGDTVIQETPELNASGRLATGIASSSRAIGEIFQDEAREKRRPTVIVGAGTPIGIFFTEPLVRDQY